jgi:hypothetical protein
MAVLGRNHGSQRGPLHAANASQDEEGVGKRSAGVTGGNEGVGFSILDQMHAHSHRALGLAARGAGRLVGHLENFGSVDHTHSIL